MCIPSEIPRIHITPAAPAVAAANIPKGHAPKKNLLQLYDNMIADLGFYQYHNPLFIKA